MAYIEALILLSIIGYLIYILGTKNYDFFEKRNIPHDKPKPYVGNLYLAFLRKRAFFNILIDYHIKFKNKFYGLYNLSNAQITIKDTELIKQIFVKDFDHFTNHFALITAEDDPLFGSGLLSLKDQKWKDMRITLSPAFTGSKLRYMFELIRDCAQNSVDYIQEEIKKIKNENNSLEYVNVDGKDLFTRYTHNVIASVAFGLKVNSYRDYNNEFFKRSQHVLNFGILALLKVMLHTYAKSIAKFFNVHMFDKEFTKYFMGLVMDTINFRVKNNIVRPDMINLLLESRNAARQHGEENSNSSNNLTDSSTTSGSAIATNIRDWTDEELVAQCLLFFFAGFETSSNLMGFAALELVANPEVQNKLYQEIQDVIEHKNNKGKSLKYEDIQGLKYLDMVISETLRKWPPAVSTDRVCNKKYTIKDGNNEVNLEPGDLIWVNIVGMHHDPENFEQPNVFDPERFSEENKSNIKQFTYIPFGIGPRACIGLRLALIQAKMVLFSLLANFEFQASEKTELPIEMDPSTMMQKPKGGFNFRLKLRESF